MEYEYEMEDDNDTGTNAMGESNDTTIPAATPTTVTTIIHLSDLKSAPRKCISPLTLPNFNHTTKRTSGKMSPKVAGQNGSLSPLSPKSVTTTATTAAYPPRMLSLSHTIVCNKKILKMSSMSNGTATATSATSGTAGAEKMKKAMSSSCIHTFKSFDTM